MNDKGLGKEVVEVGRKREKRGRNLSAGHC